MLWRLPFSKPEASRPPIDPAAQASFGALQERFATANAAVLNSFTENDQSAVAAQASHRRFQFALILGASLTATLGALQSALDDQWWPGLLLGLLGLATASLVRLQRGSRPMARYLSARAKAEELRSLYFRYLAGVDDELDERGLERAVVAVHSGREQGTS